MIDLDWASTLTTRACGVRDSIGDRLKKACADRDAMANRLESIEKAQAFIQKVAKDTQEQVRFVISDIVNLALDTCFPGEYEFGIDFDTKRGRTEASLVLRKDGIDLDPMEASGGGVVDIVAFALRIAAWSLGSTDAVLIFDEPFRFLSRDLQPRAGEIMKRLSSQLGIQVIMVSHNQDIIDSSDRVFEVSLVGGTSRIKVST